MKYIRTLLLMTTCLKTQQRDEQENANANNTGDEQENARLAQENANLRQTVARLLQEIQGLKKDMESQVERFAEDTRESNAEFRAESMQKIGEMMAMQQQIQNLNGREEENEERNLDLIQAVENHIRTSEDEIERLRFRIRKDKEKSAQYEAEK